MARLKPEGVPRSWILHTLSMRNVSPPENFPGLRWQGIILFVGWNLKWVILVKIPSCSFPIELLIYFNQQSSKIAGFRNQFRCPYILRILHSVLFGGGMSVTVKSLTAFPLTSRMAEFHLNPPFLETQTNCCTGLTGVCTMLRIPACAEYTF